MYVLLFLLLLYPGASLLHKGVVTLRSRLVLWGVILILLDIGFFILISLWGELLWFQNLNYGTRFWRLIFAKIGISILGTALACGFAFIVTFNAGVHLRKLVTTIAAAVGFIWSIGKAEIFLLYLFGVEEGLSEPILNLDTGFYLFQLPFYDQLFVLFALVAFIALIAALLVWESGGAIRLRRLNEAQGNPSVLPIANAGFAWVLACGMLIALFHLLYSEWGVVQGPGWVDVNILYPALIASFFGFILVGLLPLFSRFRVFMFRRMEKRIHIGRPAIAAMSVVWSAIALITSFILVAVPVLVQWLLIKPNEITYEKPYISHNIAFTRRGFRLHNIEERAFTPATEFTKESVENNRNLLSEVRLWDWRALDSVYRQFQEIRLYYEFVDVDVDRYTIGGRYRQLMVSARELGQKNLAPQSQTFVNKRFKYTHGYGYTAAAVSDFTEQGLPNLLVKDIPPKAMVPELAINRPEIYYGELTTEAAVVNTTEEEFDYPSGEKNIYTRYQGNGGVQLSSFWRKFIYGWKLDGTVFLFSSYPTANSRVMYDRQISTRISKIAPFLSFDEDPYIVAHDKRLFWIIDGYTKSNYYPYSQAFNSWAEGKHSVKRLNGANYVRNSVKAVVDAFNGSVEFYVFDETDPIIRTWQRTFPDLFKARKTMPEGLQKHVRYPNDLLLVQGLIYSKYHMSDSEVFYNQEDLWMRATEKHYSEIIPVEPYYVMWELPGSDKTEFVLILPFTPKNKQLLIGWIAGLSDGDNYGRFIAYNFPKENRMLGPQQVETKIDQDPFLSGQLTLWDQQGSEVIRGNVLAIPVDDALLYVEPIYLRAETAAYPELRLVAVMHGDNLSYAETFDQALKGLFKKTASVAIDKASSAELVQRAKSAFDEYLQAQAKKEFIEAAEKLQILSDSLNQLLRKQEKSNK